MLDLLRKLDPVAYAVRRARALARRRAGLSRREARLPSGLDVVYLDSGGAGAPLVLVHGIGASKDHWPPLAERLGGRFRIVVPDLPGYGESEHDADTSLAGLTAAVYELAETLELGPFHLAGSSMGGRVAAELAAAHPDAVRTLWLIDPAGARGEALSEMIERTEAGEPPPLFSRTPDEYADVVAFTMSEPPDLPRPALRVLAAEGALHYDRYRRLFDALADELRDGPTTEELLAGLDVPTLVTWGGADRVLHPSGAATIAAAMPNARAHVMPGLGHVPMLEDPEGTAAAYLAWLETVGA
ncbi:alpha/beta fold hydrolase [Rubrivirga litoralis]|uniref:Alpha/beta fold hydrolase n=1 Tax=Rubrivirga litoralis TaxID=3075598 RepID=A0ABU3BLX5_9BACT|nr:alpha/beta fold hydrolase [Rubrivirga sp. F394]MDT0630245.1 alpha/beta fold hydrolase [Rubrivirga sp. F394]